jgi:hypothetical protein
MFGSATVDIAIGLVFVYLVLSLVVTAAQEVLETIIKLRGAHLAKGIAKLLGAARAREFFASAPVAALSPDRWFGGGTRKPSYIPARTFATVVLDMIVPATAAGPRTLAAVQRAVEATADPDLKRSLTTLLDGAQTLDEVQARLQRWFDDQMDRVSGWYRRKAQVITLALGLLVAVGMNADTLAIVRSLSNDSTVRASLVAQAQEAAKQPLRSATADDMKREADARAADTKAKIETAQGLGLPVGFGWWNDVPRPVSPRAAAPGWLLTALAISLGAPFWFDMLGKVVSIRAANKPDEKRS